MVCSPANGYVAIPANVYHWFICLLLAAAIVQLFVLFDRHVIKAQ